jgi:hypothetical protein
MICRDADGNEIKVGDTVECVKAGVSPTGRYGIGDVGDRFAVAKVHPCGIDMEGDTEYQVALPTRFRKVVKETPVYPFKAGDVVECVDDRFTLGAGKHVTKGRSYKVLAARFLRRVGGSGLGVFVVDILADDGRVLDMPALRFTAPGSRSNQDTILSGVLRATITRLEAELAEARKDLDAVSTRRDVWRARAERAEKDLVKADRAVKAFQHMCNVPEVTVLDGHDGEKIVVLTKAAK